MELAKGLVLAVGVVALAAGCAPTRQATSAPSGIENTGSAGITGGAARRAPGSGQVSASGADMTFGSVFANHPEFSNWYSMSIQGNYFQEMTGSGQYTVFAPVNSAFDKVPANLVLQDLKGQSGSSMPNITRIQSVVRNQVVSGVTPPEALRQGVRLKALSGYTIAVGGPPEAMTFTMRTPRVGGGPNIGGTSVARLAGEPIVTTNGIVYPIDTLFAR